MRNPNSGTNRSRSGDRPSAGDALTWNVGGLLADVPGSTRVYPVAGVMIGLDDLRMADPLEGTVRLQRTNRGLVVTGRLTTSIEAECSRCLKEIEVPISIMLEEEVLPSIDLETGEPLDTAAEPDVLRLNDHHELDIEPAVREAIQLEEPIAPLCQEACRGLCPTCGQELAVGEHDHADEPVDPRLESLRLFRVVRPDDGDEPRADDSGHDDSRPG